MGKVLGVIAGLVAMLVISIAVQMLGPIVHPVPTGMEAKEAMAAWVATATVPAHLITAAAWLLGALGGGWLALRISSWAAAAWIVAVLDVAMALAQTLRADYPVWMQVAAVVAPLLGGWLAMRLAPGGAGDSIDGQAAG